MSQYVRAGHLGRMGRLARANRVSGMGRAGFASAWDAAQTRLGFPTITQQNTLRRWLGQAGYDYTDYLPDAYSPATSPFYSSNPAAALSTIQASPSGGLTTADASVISAAITAAGKVGKQAIIGTPTLTYNPATGTYVATGGATVPTSAALTSELSEYLPLILLAGGAILLFSAMGKR